jgi:hypothetical protein
MKRILGIAFSLLALTLYAQTGEQQADQPPAPGDLAATTEAMSHRHHHDHEHMSAHMHITTLRDPEPGDAEKAQRVANQARVALEHYRDANVALAEGFKIFLPNIPQPMYHFTKWQYAVGEAFRFDPTKPTSLLYEKRGGEFKLIGAMYTAPVGFTEEQLNDRIPLSVAQWHQHVNLCKAPKGREIEMLRKNPEFGLAGSISSPEACAAAGSTFLPHIFGWMVHVYPWEMTPDAVWSVERQLKQQAVSH